MNTKTQWIITTASAMIFGCASGAFIYLQYSSQQSRQIGRIEAENSFLKDQVSHLKQDNTALRLKVDESTAANNLHLVEASHFKSQLQQRDTQLADANRQIEQLSGQAQRFAALADSSKRCAPDREEIVELQKELAGRSFASFGHPPDAQRKAEINALLDQHHKTLQTCLSAKA